jgi:hypothetical protein
VRYVHEQYLWKGPRVLYHAALRAQGGKLEVVFRWQNCRTTGSQITPCASEERGRALVDQKVAELCGRGYEKRPRLLHAQSPAEAGPDVTGILHSLAPPAQRQPDSLESQLERRRREAAWSIG